MALVSVTAALVVTLILMANVFHVMDHVLKVSSEACEMYATIVVLGLVTVYNTLKL